MAKDMLIGNIAIMKTIDNIGQFKVNFNGLPPNNI